MDPRLKSKSDLYIFSGYVLFAVVLAINPLTFLIFRQLGYLPPLSQETFHANDIRYYLPALLDIIIATNAALIVFSPRKLSYYLNNSLPYNFFMFVSMLGSMFSMNVILAGQLIPLRILYLLVLLFFLTNTLFQAVVKKRDGAEIHPFYRNLVVSAFGLGLVLIVLEGAFMFHSSTHRFNGTLGSRAWFANHWDINSEGYRDIEHDSALVKGKRKIMVVGDSFVAGHGIKNPKDRFSDLLGSKLPPNEYVVFNLGVGGSDTRDEYERLVKFHHRPDLLIISWYPNDIEQEGELFGLKLQRAQSYHDLVEPFTYLARRSYLWNYVYWRLPHPSELTNYFGYIQQCFAYLKVRMHHLRELDRLISYGDSLHVPMAAVVFPFLDNAEGSAFATDVIEARFRMHHVPVLSVRQMLLGKPAIDYVVNQNDPHPNERLHAMVADSLFKMLSASGAFEQKPQQPDLLNSTPLERDSVTTVPKAAPKKQPSKPKSSKKSKKSSKPKKPLEGQQP